MAISYRNIIKVFHLARPEEVAAGLDWYPSALRFAAELDPLGPEMAAGVIAALSPQKDWEGNKLLASQAYAQGYATGHYGLNCQKANAIMNGTAPLDALGGNKVRAFWQCIAEPDGEHGAVCVDRHAADVAAGYVSDTGDRSKLLQRKSFYETVAAEYRKAAAILGILPHHVQAVTWVTWRRMKAEGKGYVELS